MVSEFGLEIKPEPGVIHIQIYQHLGIQTEVYV